MISGKVGGSVSAIRVFFSLLAAEMLGAGLHFGRGEDRFYNPMKARRNHQNQLPQRPRNGGRVSAAAAAKGRVVNSENRELESRSAASDEAAEVSGSSPVKATRSNLDRFLESTTPSVPAQYLPKVIFQCLMVSVFKILIFRVLSDVFFLMLI